MTKQKKVLIGILISQFFLAVWFIIGCPGWVFSDKCPFMKQTEDNAPFVTLKIVGPWDNRNDWKDIISKFNKYKKSPKNGFLDVNIIYEKISEEEYENAITEMQFGDKGPNIFMVFHSWIPKYQKKILPMPEEMMSISEFEKSFARVAKDDLISGGKIYSLPLYVDTLALYYNKDMFFNKGFTVPPATWKEFQNYVEELTILDGQKNIIRAGAAFGGGKNVNRSVDIIMLLVMQNNAMNIDNIKNISSFTTTEAATAIKFYTDFTDSQKRYYTWNANQMYSIDAFTNRQAAMMINYSHHVENIIKKTSGTLDFGIAPIPQVDENNNINYANYWVPVVAKKSPCATRKKGVDCYDLAWEFLEFAAQEKNVKSYVDSINRPAANLTVIQEQRSDLDDIRNVFAHQVLTSKSWFHPDDKISDKALEKMIDSIISTEKNRVRAITGEINVARKSIEQRY